MGSVPDFLHQVAHAAANGDRLAGDMLAGVAGEEKRSVRDVLRSDGGIQTYAFEHAAAHLVIWHAESLRLGFNDPFDAIALDHPGLDAVDAHLVGPRLGREAL